MMGDNIKGTGETEIVQEKVSLLDLWKLANENRNLEIKQLWGRSALLITPLLLAFTGYGMLWLNMFENGFRFSIRVFHLISIAICCFGICNAVFWICMSKGSKYVVETYELIIHGILRKMIKDEDPLFELADFVSNEDPRRTLSKECVIPKDSFCPFNLKPFRFSLSKLNIAFGVFIMCVWIVIGVFHFVSLFNPFYHRFVFCVYIKVAFFLFALTLICTILVCRISGNKNK